MSDEEDLYYVENVDQFIDFISDLRPFPHIIEQIMKYLNTRELCLISLVSKSWRDALSETLVAKERRDRYVKKVRKLRQSVGQENWPIKKKTPVLTPVTTRQALGDIRNVYRSRKPRSSRSTSHLTHTQTPNTRQRQRDMNLRGMR